MEVAAEEYGLGAAVGKPDQLSQRGQFFGSTEGKGVRGEVGKIDREVGGDFEVLQRYAGFIGGDRVGIEVGGHIVERIIHADRFGENLVKELKPVSLAVEFGHFGEGGEGMVKVLPRGFGFAAQGPGMSQIAGKFGHTGIRQKGILHEEAEFIPIAVCKRGQGWHFVHELGRVCGGL